MADSANTTTVPSVSPGSSALHHFRPAGCPTGVDPARWRQVITDRVNAHLAAAEALISALDGADPDPDLEANGDELDVSWPEGFRPFETSLSEDAEEDDAPEEDDPGGGDVQDEPHDEIAEGNDEPNLGRRETINQGADSYTGSEFELDGPLLFDGNGYQEVNALLRGRGLSIVRVSPGYGKSVPW